MIIYNIRRNGPYEYDKFILNMGQIHNNTEYIKEKYDTFKQTMDNLKLDNILNEETGRTSSLQILMYKLFSV